MPSRPHPSPDDGGKETAALRRKLADLVSQRRYSEALRAREQALRRRPDLDLQPSEAQLWCLEGRQAAAEGQGKRAEGAFRKALALGLNGESHVALARLWLDQGKTEPALGLIREAFEAGDLPPAFAGAYLKLLLLTGDLDQIRTLIRDQPRRFQSHQLQWAAGAISLLEGDPANARRQFSRMGGAATPGDHGAVWRAWACLEAGDPSAAAAILQGEDHPACAAVALDLVARGGQHPAELLDLTRRDLPRRELALGLALLHQLRQHNLLGAAQLLLAHERPLLSALPELVPLRRPLLRLAGQQALERDAPVEAIACWRPIVDRPAFDADLALRLYPLFDQGEAEQDVLEAERLASQLLGWARRAARDTPSAWPEPLLSTTLARLHCWQADQHMRLGARQQARRCVEQASQLAPELPDVRGRQGMVAFLRGDVAAAIPLLWQALDDGCRSRHVYEVLGEALELTDQRAEQRRLGERHGATFGDAPPPEGEGVGGIPPWLEALSQPDATLMARVLRASPDPGAALEALRVFVEHVSLPAPSDGGKAEAKPGKVSLALPAASDRWEALLASLDPADQVEALTAVLVAIHRFCRRVGKAISGEIARRQEQLERLAAEPGTAHGERALRALLLLHGLRLKRSAAPGAEMARLLRRAHQPERALPLALLDLRLLASTMPWRAMVDDLRRQDPQQPLLTLALATMERTSSIAYMKLSQEAFEQARRQQDSVALAACGREREWVETHPERPRGRRPLGLREDLDWNGLLDQMDFQSILRAIVQERGGGEPSDADLETMLPDIYPLARRAILQLVGQAPVEDGMPSAEEGEREPPPHQRGRGRRRTSKNP
ncbi:MAG: hypothetical protein ACK5QW_09180 [Cyanobacteriota bacterium]